jgi:glyoxylase-like metal-dependent hydrolase (beta-lactamase superfamily II)
VLKRILLGLGVVLGLVVLAVAGLLVEAHRAIDRERAPLPSRDELARFVDAPADDLPVRLSWIDTASQPMPRSAVLDPGKDPSPQERYVLGLTVFALEWADGRILLIDAGMRRDAALAFGKPFEKLGGASPIVVHTEVGEALGGAVERVRGIVFTHLHSDHVDGVVSLCAARGRAELPAFMTIAQAERPNYTTRPGLALIEEAACVRKQPLADGAALRTLPGFPGIAVIDAGGHTPGSEIILARVAGPGSRGVDLFAFAGDTVNHLDGVRYDIAKPFVYRTFLIPESEERQGELRRFLASLARERGFTVLVSHDELALRASKVPLYSSEASAAPAAS